MKCPPVILACVSLAAIACADNPTTTPLVDDPAPLVTDREEAPVAEKPSPPAPPEKPRMVDTLGRLIPGESTPWGFVLPRGATLEQKSPAMTLYQLRATRQALLEFYTHRRYHVVRRGSGHQVLHSGDTLQDLDRSLEGARLVIHPQARHVFSLRFFPPHHAGGPSNVGDDSQNAPQRPHPSAGSSPGNTPRPGMSRAPRRPLRQEETFNPKHRKNEGVLRTGPLVDKWKSQRPGHTFYD